MITRVNEYIFFINKSALKHVMRTKFLIEFLYDIRKYEWYYLNLSLNVYVLPIYKALY